MKVRAIPIVGSPVTIAHRLINVLRTSPNFVVAHLPIQCEEVGRCVQTDLVEGQGVFSKQMANFFNGFEVVDAGLEG